MKIEHVHATQNDGRVIAVTKCTYSDGIIGGNPMAASFHGWLSIEEVKQTLKIYRSIDAQQQKANNHDGKT